MGPWLHVLLSSWGTAAAAEPPAEPYATVVALVQQLFLQPELVDARRLLIAAGRELEQEIPWLFVRETPQGLEIRHGQDELLDTVPWPGLDTLAPTLARLVAELELAGHPLDGVDPSLAVLTGMVEGLDRFSRILADEKLDRFNVRLSGTLVGIGATFGLDGEQLVVGSVTADGPAAASGLRAGDRLLRVDGRSTVGMPTSEVTRRIRGESGTQVRLQVRRGDDELAVVCTRAEVVVPNVVTRVLDGGVGYLAVDHVSQRTVENLEAALRDLRTRGAVDHGLVLDLRGNTGGSMKESAWAADLFLHEGELLRTVGKDGTAVQNLQAEMSATDDGSEPDVPIVVLVDERTASGAEIMAGALLELDRAALVGRRTYGKGTVQKIYDLAPDVRLKLTVARYLLANGRSISDGGLVPDVTAGRVVPLSSGLWYRGFDAEEVGVPFAEVLPQLVGAGPDDLPLELARRAVARTVGPDREDLVTSLEVVAAETRLEQEAALAALLADRGVVWTPAPPGAPTSALRSRVEVATERDGGDRYRLRVTLTNPEAADLYRARVQVRSPSASWWDGVEVPLGHVPAGGVVTGVAEVTVPVGIEPRVDQATLTLSADRRPSLELGPRLLPSAGDALPTLRLTARLAPGAGGASSLQVVVQQLGREPLSGVEVHLGYPESDAVELLDWARRIGDLPGRSERAASLDLRVAPGTLGDLAMSVSVEDDAHGTLLEWPLSVPVDGRAVVLQAPTLALGPLPSRAAPGSWPLSVVANDDDALDHVVVTVNGRKVAWSDGGGANRLELLPAIELRGGENRVTATVVDGQGLRTKRTVVVYGDGPEAVSAED